MRGILLGHLSKENNLPELAYETVRVELMSREKEIGWHVDELPIGVASRKEASPMFEY